MSVEFSPAEAMRMLAALRQYEPYWSQDGPLSPAEQLAAIREEITSVMWKIEVAMLLGTA